MSDSPFAAVEGVSMSVSADAPEQQSGPPDMPQATPQNPHPMAQPRQGRARTSDFSRGAGRMNVDVELVGQDPDDPFSPLVERSIVGNKGAELARSHPKQQAKPEPQTIEAEVEEASRVAEQDAGVETAQAEVIDRDERIEASDPRIDAWRKKAEILDSLLTGADMPEEYMAAFVPMDFGNGRKGRLSISELKRGHLREADYHRKLKDAHAIKAQAEQTMHGMNQIVGALTGGDVQAYFQAMRYLRGGWETFKRAAVVLGLQMDAERRMKPEERQLLEQNRQYADDLYRMQVEMQSLRAQQQAQQVQQAPGVDAEFFGHQLSQMMPIALKRLEAKGTPYVDSAVSRKFWKPTWDFFVETFDGELTTDKVEEVIISIQQQAEDYIASGAHEHEPAASKLLPPVARTAPAPAQSLARQAGAPNYAGQSVNQAPRGSGANGAPQRARIGEIAHINRQQAYR